MSTTMNSQSSTLFAASNTLTNPPSENWDDDFLFQSPTDPNPHPATSPSRPPSTVPRATSPVRLSYASSSAWDEPLTPAKPAHPDSDSDDDDDDDFGGHGSNDHDHTITSRGVIPLHLQKEITTPFPSSQNQSQTSWQETEDDGLYDRDFEEPPPLPKSRPPLSIDPPPLNPYATRQHQSRHPSSSQPHLPLSQPPTAQSHASHSRSVSAIHLPYTRPSSASPHPTLSSTFTLPSPSHYSREGSLALRSTFSENSARGLLRNANSPVQAKDIPRPRRRLRKKSRPHQPFAASSSTGWKRENFASETEGSLFEEDERDVGWEPTVITTTSSKHTYESPPPLPRAPSPPPPPVPSLPVNTITELLPKPSNPPIRRNLAKLHKPSPPPRAPTPASQLEPPKEKEKEKEKEKTPILSRIGSMKRWRSKGSSRPSSSHGPSESESSPPSTSLHPLPPNPKTPEPQLPTPPSRGWLFRSNSSSVSPEAKRFISASPSDSSSIIPGRRGSIGASRERGLFGRGGRRGSTPAEDIVEHEAESQGAGEEEWEVKLKSSNVGNATGTVAGFGKKDRDKINNAVFPQSPTFAPSLPNKRPISYQPQRATSPSPLQQISSGNASLGRRTPNPFLEEEEKERGAGLFRRLSNAGKGRHRRNISNASASSVRFLEEDDIPEVPPISLSLSPPSPPDSNSKATGASSLFSTSSTTPTPTHKPSSSALERLLLQPSASLGRSSAIVDYGTEAEVLDAGGSSSGMRRNSLGDLKIPARISMAQGSLKSNLGMVREFAGTVDGLKKLQVAHQGLVQAVKSRNYALPSSLSPFPSSSSSTVVLQDAVGKIDEQYALWWEYAELLVELGGGPSTEDPVDSKDSKPPAPTTTTMTTQGHPPKNRERAITLAGASSSSTPFMVPPDTSNKRSKSPPRATPAQWRASTGRHDLSQRQLTLLKEMLVGNPEDNISRTLPPDRSSGRLSPIPKPASQSAVTLPSSVISSDPSATPIKPPSSSKNALPVPQSPHAEGKIRRASRAGFMGIRDILKSFNKKSGAESATAAGSNQSQSSVTSSSVDDHGRPRTPANLPPLPVSPPPPLPAMTSLPPLNAEHAQRKRRGKGSTDVVAVIQQHPNSPYNNTNPRKSPRRPSLASIFRLGQANSNLSNLPTKKKSRSRGREAGKRGAKSSTTENETEAEEEYSDWDRMDSASDIDLSLRALGAGGGQEKDEATVKGRKRFVPKNPPPLPLLSSASQVSLSKLQASPSKPPRPKSQSQSRGLPPPALLNNNQSTPRASQQPHQTQPVQSVAPPLPLPDPRLALTPENIKPLLEYARQVSARLNDCVEELRALGVVEVTSTGGMS